MAGGATACGSSTPAASGASAPQQVLTILSNGNRAIDADQQHQLASKAGKALAPEFASLAQQLRSVDYPASAQSDASALEAALEQSSRTAGALGTAKSIAAVNLVHTLSEDEATAATASAALRRDLGLPAS